MTFSDTDMKELGRSTQKKITIQDPYLSSMSQTSCSRKKLSQWKNVNTHTHTHTHTHTRTHTHAHTHTHTHTPCLHLTSQSQG